ncbi:Fic family protein [Candidatus Nanosalina sp. VS9-1]|uniref:Fic family protein n=1 Tax=Candidatus Nanosalina sp. VS9-1 TaxID=3388566 RepID=UPI0039E0970A
MIEGPELEDFLEAHELAGQVSEIRTPGFKQSTEKGMRKLAGVVNDAKEFEDPYRLAAFILIETINKHAFNDGNHRTAWIVAKKVLRKNKEEMRVEKIKSFDEIESDLKSEVKFKDVDQVSSWIRTGDFQ